MSTISTAIPTPEYEPLLDAIHAAAAICGEPGATAPRPEGGFALHVLSRWAANAQAFVVLRNAGLMTDAYGVARMGSELAIIAAWVTTGDSSSRSRFRTPGDRVTALIEDGIYSTRVWLDKMRERDPSRAPIDPATQAGRQLLNARRPKLPHLEVMASCSDASKDQYAFAYRGESGAVHSAARVLLANAEGRPPVPEQVMLHGVLVAALIVFAAAGEMLGGDPRAQQAAAALREALEHRLAGGNRGG